MSSLVLELQRDAMDGQACVTDLLRKAVVVATKLQISELRDWALRELTGYQGDVEFPNYRCLHGQAEAFNPAQNRWMPVIWTSEPHSALTQREAAQPIAEVEDLLRNDYGSGRFQMPYPEAVRRKLIQGSDLGLVPTLVVSRASLVGILDAVRNIILEWSLKLEQDGILGENMSFSSEERQKAAGHTYNITNFSGILGNISGGNVQIGDYNSIHAELKKRGVSEEECNLLEAIVAELKTASPEQRKNLFQKGTAWLLRNAAQIGTLSEVIRHWFEHSQ